MQNTTRRSAVKARGFLRWSAPSWVKKTSNCRAAARLRRCRRCRHRRPVERLSSVRSCGRPTWMWRRNPGRDCPRYWRPASRIAGLDRRRSRGLRQAEPGPYIELSLDVFHCGCAGNPGAVRLHRRATGVDVVGANVGCLRVHSMAKITEGIRSPTGRNSWSSPGCTRRSEELSGRRETPDSGGCSRANHWWRRCAQRRCGDVPQLNISQRNAPTSTGMISTMVTIVNDVLVAIGPRNLHHMWRAAPG